MENIDPIYAIDYALLLGEMEGVCAHLKKVRSFEDLEIIELMKKKYYKEYFRRRKLEHDS